MEYYPQKEKMKRESKAGPAVVGAIFLAVLTSAWLLWPALRSWIDPLSSLHDGETVGVYIGNGVINAETAVSREKQYQGLSDRTSLAENSGMLFIFAQPARYYFTMRGMEFPLDFIWISDDKVVDLTANVAQPTGGKKPVLISPDHPVNMVLEVNAGTIDRFKVAVGDSVKIRVPGGFF